MCGIYKITNTITGKSYVGQSIHIEQRWNEHLRDLRNNKHDNAHLQSSYNKYGEEAFGFVVIKICEESDLDFYEEKYIAEFNCVDNGYNLTYGGESASRSQATRDKIKTIVTDLWKDDEYKKHMSEAHKGKHFQGGGVAKGTHRGFENSNSDPVLVDGAVFGSKSLAAEYIGCSVTAINKAIRENRKCKNHIIELCKV